MTDNLGPCPTCGDSRFSFAGHAGPCNTRFFVPADPYIIRAYNKAHVESYIDNPVKRVLEFGQKKGPKWNEWCQRVASILEAANARDKPLVTTPSSIGDAWMRTWDLGHEVARLEAINARGAVRAKLQPMLKIGAIFYNGAALVCVEVKP